jgi:Kdo2-lipid IVA lauroyltransferase/acyltransferase
VTRPPDRKTTPLDYLATLALRGLLAVTRVLPYKTRNRVGGWVFRQIVARVGSYRQRIDQNLTLIYPDMPPRQRQTLRKAIATNVGRTFMENFNAAAFQRRAAGIAPRGPGFEALQQARRQGRPAIIISGHFGNWEAIRAVLQAHGMETGALYREQNNPHFEKIFRTQIELAGKPMFQKGPSGARDMIRHIRKGGFTAILLDQKSFQSPVFDFLGQPAQSSTSAADMALRYNALLVPAYGTRTADGQGIEVDFEAPVAHSDALSMTQDLTDSLARRITDHPEQWFWIHRRWHIRH